MKRLAVGIFCSAFLILTTVPASASNGAAQVTFTQEQPSACKNMGEQLFEDPVWITVTVNGECVTANDPIWIEGGRGGDGGKK